MSKNAVIILEHSSVNESKEGVRMESSDDILKPCGRKNDSPIDLPLSIDLFRQLAELTNEGVWLLDCDGKISYINSRMAELLGCLPDDLIGKPLDIFASEPEVAAACEDRIHHPQSESKSLCVAFRRADGTPIQVILRMETVRDDEGDTRGVLGFVLDNTQQIQVENRLRQNNRSLKVLSESNQALIRAGEERDLLQEICDIVVKVGGYRLAWVGYPTSDCADGFRTIAYASDNQEKTIQSQELFTSSLIESKDFISAIILGEPYIIPENELDSFVSALDAGVKSYGVNSAIGLPLLDNKQVIGVLGILSKDFDTFVSEEVALLTELANDLSYGILSLRARDERIKAREALRFTQFSIDHATDPIYWVGTGGRIVDANIAACKSLGYTQEELLAMTVFDLDPKYSDEIWAKQWGSSQPHGSITFESVHRRKDGTEFPVEITSNFLEYNGKHFSCSFTRDITERKRVETALRESEEKFRSLVENTVDWFWEIDEATRYCYVSPRIRDLLGYAPEEVLGKTPFDLMPPKEALGIKGMFQAYLNRLETFSCLENMLVHKDGRHIIVETSGSPIIDEQGVFRGYRGIDRDVTARKKSEHELTVSLERLQRSIEGAVEAMALTVEMKDPYTAGHQRRVAQLAWAIAKGMGLSRDQVEGVRLAAMVHDIGKIYVPAEILSKPGRISEIEFSLIQTHPKVGYDVLKTIEFPWPIAQIVLQHHERLNGKGYPSGLHADEILLEAKIISVADVVEAMSSHRPYRPAVGIGQALEEITKRRGEFYDPYVVDICLALFRTEEFTFESLAASG